MRSLLPELLDDLDQGIGICDIDTLCFIEYNNKLSAWFDSLENSNCLADYISEANLKHLRNSITKNRKYRFRRLVSIKSREETVYFNARIIELSDSRRYLVVQGVIDNSEAEIQSLIRNHSDILEKSRELLKEEKEKAEAANVAKSAFIATMSHEIRTPMNGVLGMAQQMAKSDLNETQLVYLKGIQNSGNQLLSIINEILDFSKIEAGKMELHEEPCDLKELIDVVVQMFLAGGDLHDDIELKSTFHQSEYPVVLVDDVRLKQVLMNLLSNAIKFTAQGTVDLSLNLLASDNNSCQVAFCVSDSGIGMDQDKIDHLFDAFTQYDSSTTRHYGGTGLGLSICKQLLELMGGSILVESELGKGSVFKVILNLPVVEQEVLGEALDSSDLNNTNINLNGKRILVAEDTMMNQELIKMALEEYDIEFYMADNGEEAVNLFRKNEVDLVLMDCLMPVMDGFDASQSIRSIEPAGRYVPIVAITASSISDEIKQRCDAAGIDEIMYKPFDFDDLVDKVNFWSNVSTASDHPAKSQPK